MSSTAIEAEVVDEQSGAQTGTSLAALVNQPQPTALSALRDETHKQIQQVRDSLIWAKSNPRNVEHCRQKILAECRRPGFAETALYRKPMGGGFAEGLSIHFARAARIIWGNMKTEVKELATMNGSSLVLVCATDLETNVPVEVEVTIKHVRYSKAGGLKSLINPDEIYMEIAKRTSIIERNCILSLIPADIKEEAEREIRKTRLATAKAPDASKKIVAAFDTDLKVTQDQLEAYLKKSISQVTAEDIDTLRGVYRAIKDGESKVEDVFGGAVVETEKKQPVERKANRRAELKKQKEDEAGADVGVDVTETDATTGEVINLVVPEMIPLPETVAAKTLVPVQQQPLF